MSVSPNLQLCISGIVRLSFCRILVVVASLTPLPAAGQESLTLDRAVQAALAHNASLRAVRAGVDDAAAQVAQARSGF